MKFVTLIIACLLMLMGYCLGRRDGFNECAGTNSRIQEIMASVDISQFKDEAEIQKYVAEQLGIKPEDIFIEKVVIDLDENDE